MESERGKRRFSFIKNLGKVLTVKGKEREALEGCPLRGEGGSRAQPEANPWGRSTFSLGFVHPETVCRYRT